MSESQDNKICMHKPLIAIVGPTASGKSNLAQELAIRLGAEVVSADSMQIYRGMDIGTGKLSEEDQCVRHWGIDLIDPGETYSVARYQAYARDCFRSIDSSGKRVILCGGTGLYISSALYDLRFPKGEQIDNKIREHFTRIAEEHGVQALWDLLQEKDPHSAELIHPNNVRRVVRALEMFYDGTSYAEHSKNAKHLSEIVPHIQIGLTIAPEALGRKIDERVDIMVASGLIDEVEHLVEQGFRESLTSPQAIGYKEIADALDGRYAMEEAVNAIKKATRRYAKRQRTWLRRDPRIHWIDTNEMSFSDLLEESMRLIDTNDKLFNQRNGI